MSITQGLKFKKLDLHVHTPASECFVGAGVTPDAIVAEAVKKGLAGIAITDHNTGAWVDRVKEAAQGKPLVVFPGMEILVPAGAGGIHVLAILDTSKTTKGIDELIGALKLRKVEGHYISELSLYEVLEVITGDIHKGLAVLAHCNGPKGAISEMTGVQKTSVFQHPNLLAVEVAQDDFTDKEKIAKRERVVDLLDGAHPEYCNRRLAIIQSSDNPHPTQVGKHGLEGIGARYTYYKMDDRIDLESLRLCFVDRETRIRQSFEFKEQVFPHIEMLRIKGGFLDGAVMPLHEGLNCILGAKGAGKSLLVEFIRFGLDQPPTQQEVLADHGEKLEERLQRYGEVATTLVDETGKHLLVTRTYNPDDNNPYKEQEAEQITRLFPVLFLSQNEIIRIAENEDEQLKFIDRFFDFRSYQNTISGLEEELSEQDRDLANCLRAYHLNKEQKKQLSVFEGELETIAQQMKNPVFDEFARADRKERTLSQQRQFLVGLASKIKAIREQEIVTLVLPALAADVKDDPAVKRMADLCEAQKAFAVDSLLSLEAQIENALGHFEREYSTFRPTFVATKQKYDEAVKEQKGDYRILDQRRLRLIKDKEELALKLRQSQALVDRLKGVKQNRDGRLGELNETYKNYRRERLLKCKKFEADSAGKLSISINESTNVDEFKARLTSLKRGTYLTDEEIEKICNGINAYDFIFNILRYDSAQRSQVFLDPVVKATGVDIAKVRRLADHLLEQNQYEDLLELQYRARPQDRPEIRYRVSNTRYELLRKLSVGQKCTSMLIMALSDGAMPIVIDQPEDSLDIRSIWEDMCLKLRSGKERRQFIFTTHNSSLAVASDTDKYLVLEADASSGHVAFAGAIDSERVREQVIEYLEGGVHTYRAKYLKYNIPRDKLYS
jgi:PHP family Zn ribbon phosphoesterase